jgi:chloramphenicol-sensitive protein RarD
MRDSVKGASFALLAYLFWGLFPSFWKLLSSVAPTDILAARIVFSCLCTTLLLLFRKNTAWLSLFREKRNLPRILISAVLAAINWGVYIFAVNTGRTVESSLGYFINPLVSIALGLLLFHEKLTAARWAAFVIAAIGVVLLTIFTGVFPIIALTLAFSFAFYGVAKKTLRYNALEALAAETLVSIPIACALVFFSHSGLSRFADFSPAVIMLLILAGPVTVLPLVFFAKGARLIPLSTLGFIQFINPILQFISGVFIFHEAFPRVNYIAFGFIWTAAALYCLSYTPLFQKKA